MYEPAFLVNKCEYKRPDAENDRMYGDKTVQTNEANHRVKNISITFK
jgi:hypothetical protein